MHQTSDRNNKKINGQMILSTLLKKAFMIANTFVIINAFYMRKYYNNIYSIIILLISKLFIVLFIYMYYN